METIYHGTLNRFGGTIECYDTDIYKCEEKIMEKYTEIYKRSNNGDNPKDFYEHSDTENDFNCAQADIAIEEVKLGDTLFW